MVILYYHTLAFENRADSVKKYGDIIFFYLFGVFGGWDAKRECAQQTSAKDTLPFLLGFFLCCNQIRNDGQQDLQDHKADHNLTVGPFVFQADMVMQRCSCIFEDRDFQETE